MLPENGGLSAYQYYNLRISEFYFQRPKVCLIKNEVTEPTNKNHGGKMYPTCVYIFTKWIISYSNYLIDSGFPGLQISTNEN
jgi:hypothetical protein